MPRNTKEEARATRERILDAAERVFEEHGVSASSLHRIADAAGVTRGAIYWHFADKAALFDAMMERATMPLEGGPGLCFFGAGEFGIGQLRDAMVAVLRRVVDEPQMRRVFGIAIHRVEYAGETLALRDRHLAVRNQSVDELRRTLSRAMQRGELGRRLTARSAAIGLHALLDGLLQNWMLDPEGFDLVKVGRETLDAYLRGLAADAVAPTVPALAKRRPRATVT